MFFHPGMMIVYLRFDSTASELFDDVGFFIH